MTRNEAIQQLAGYLSTHDLFSNLYPNELLDVSEFTIKFIEEHLEMSHIRRKDTEEFDPVLCINKMKSELVQGWDDEITHHKSYNPEIVTLHEFNGT